MKQCKFDERQMATRGKIFKEGFFILVSGILIKTYLQAFDIAFFEPFKSDILVIVLATSYLHIRMFMKDAIHFDDIKMQRFAYFDLLLGIFLFFVTGYEVFRYVVEPHSDEISNLIYSGIMSVAFMSIGCLYFYFRHNSNMKLED